jgi:L-alanine-DL-glutamate epimerase-like enolase superfamily enzyme
VSQPNSDGVTAVRLRFYAFPTQTGGSPLPESDGTATWDSTGVLVAEVSAADQTGIGYAYTVPAAHSVAREMLAPLLRGTDPQATSATFWRMAKTVRNAGWEGVCAGAISALDISLHDLKGKLLDVSLLDLLGAARDRVAAYGSGGFTNYTDSQLSGQLSDWAAQGLRSVKMKIGSDPDRDVARVATARAAIGPDIALYVDANGAYNHKQALGLAQQFADYGVTWFEEPVSSNDLRGLKFVRDHGPAGMRIAAGEYGYTPDYFWAMLSAGAIDVLQGDGTRCGGVTGFALAAAQAQGAGIPFSAHTAPALHASLGAAYPGVANVEYFHDHVRIEKILFDGLPELVNGNLLPDRSRPGHGLQLKERDGEPFMTKDWGSS